MFSLLKIVCFFLAKVLVFIRQGYDFRYALRYRHIKICPIAGIKNTRKTFNGFSGIFYFGYRYKGGNKIRDQPPLVIYCNWWRKRKVFRDIICRYSCGCRAPPSVLNFKKIQVGGNGHVIPSWQGLYKQDIKLTKNKWENIRFRTNYL